MPIDEQRPRVVGGGPKKLLYAADTIFRMGVGKSAKALTARNTCKACAYGMGGQLGGMTNELGEFATNPCRRNRPTSSPASPTTPSTTRSRSCHG